jgi:hypothetical protein
MSSGRASRKRKAMDATGSNGHHTGSDADVGRVKVISKSGVPFQLYESPGVSEAQSHAPQQNVASLRDLVAQSLEIHLFDSAVFWADKLCTFSGRASEDVYLLGRCFMLAGQEKRAVYWLQQHLHAHSPAQHSFSRSATPNLSSFSYSPSSTLNASSSPLDSATTLQFQLLIGQVRGAPFQSTHIVYSSRRYNASQYVSTSTHTHTHTPAQCHKRRGEWDECLAATGETDDECTALIDAVHASETDGIRRTAALCLLRAGTYTCVSSFSLSLCMYCDYDSHCVCPPHPLTPTRGVRGPQESEARGGVVPGGAAARPQVLRGTAAAVGHGHADLQRVNAPAEPAAHAAGCVRVLCYV